jgi:hypothetical protein
MFLPFLTSSDPAARPALDSRSPTATICPTYQTSILSQLLRGYNQRAFPVLKGPPKIVY